MSTEILISIISALYLLLVALLAYVWVSSDKRNDKRFADINENLKALSDEFTKSLDRVYSEIRKVAQQGVDAERRFLNYKTEVEKRYARKEDVRELKNHLSVVRS